MKVIFSVIKPRAYKDLQEHSLALEAEKIAYLGMPKYLGVDEHHTQLQRNIISSTHSVEFEVEILFFFPYFCVVFVTLTDIIHRENRTTFSPLYTNRH